MSPARRTAIPEAAGLEAPLYVLPNGAGLGYGYFQLDDASRGYLLDHVEDVADPLTRGSAWVTLWDNMLERRVPPDALFDAAVRALAREADEQNAQRVLGYAVRAYWRFLTPRQRAARVPAFEAALRAGLARAPTQSQKAAWFNAFRDVVASAEGTAWLERVWRRQEAVPGLTLAEQDEIAMAFELAVREVPGWEAILAAQLRAHREPRSQGAVRVRDAGAVGRPGRTGAGLRAVRASSRTAAARPGCWSRCSISTTRCDPPTP